MSSGDLVNPVTCRLNSLLSIGIVLTEMRLTNGLGTSYASISSQKAIVIRFVMTTRTGHRAQTTYGSDLRDQIRALLLKTGLGCSEMINMEAEQRLRSLQTTAASSEAPAGFSSVPDVSGASSTSNKQTVLIDITLLEAKDHLISIND